MKPWPLIALLIPLSGCLQGEAPVETEYCILDMCVLTEAEPYWQEYRERFGLGQVPLTHGGRAGGFEIGDGFMVWSRGGNETVQSEFYALDLGQNRIIPFGTRTVERTMDREIHGRKVVFALEDTSLAGLERFSMWMWSLDNETRWRLPIGLEGVKHPDGYDGEWVVFTNTLRTYRAVELWAYNVNDGRLLQLFQPEPRNRHENGTYETVRTPVLHEGTAYYTVGWLLEDGDYWTDFYATELETNTTTLIKRLAAVDVHFLDADGAHLSYADAEDAWVLELNSPSDPLKLPKTKPTNNGPQLRGGWVFYGSRDGLVSDLIAYNLTTDEHKVIVEGDEEFMPGFMTIQGDDAHILAQVVNPYEEGPYHALRVFTLDRSALP